MAGTGRPNPCPLPLGIARAAGLVNRNRSAGMSGRKGFGVSDGIRTRDIQIHSLELYQLSYAHRENRDRENPLILL